MTRVQPEVVDATRWMQCVRRTYLVFLLLVITDLTLIALTPTVRNALGRIDGLGWAPLAARIAPSVILLGFYSWFLTKGIRSKRTATTAVALHSAVFSLLGLAILLPWLGLFAAALTPISPVYIGALLWLPAGYYAGSLAALVFIGVNLALGKGALAHRGASARESG